MLIGRKTWTYVPRTSDMKPITFKCTFREKYVYEYGRNFLYRAIFVLRGDLHGPYDHFDTENIYVLVETPEIIRLILAFTSHHNLILGGADISNSSLYSPLYKPTLMERPTDSKKLLLHPGFMYFHTSQSKAQCGLNTFGAQNVTETYFPANEKSLSMFYAHQNRTLGTELDPRSRFSFFDIDKKKGKVRIERSDQLFGFSRAPFVLFQAPLIVLGENWMLRQG